MTQERTVQDTPAPRPRTLADLRKQAGLTQEQVGKAIGVTQSRVSRIEAEFPEVAFSVVQSYLRAVGGRVAFRQPDLSYVAADDFIADPRRSETVRARHLDPGRSPLRRSAEELPLQGDTAQSGSDHPGRNEDHSDAQGDEGDSGQRQQP